MTRRLLAIGSLLLATVTLRAQTHGLALAVDGYTDVSGKQLVRTSGDRLYVVAVNCASYPCTDSAQTVHVYKANATGTPASVARQDSAHEPADAGGVAAAIDGSDVIHIVWLDRNGASHSRVRYNTFSTSTDLWGTAEDVDADVEGAAGWTDVGQGDQFVAVAVDSSSKPHVAYLKTDGTRRRVNYRNRVAGSWSSATLIDNNSYGANEKAWHPNLAFDTSGRRVFAWHGGAFNTDQTGQLHVRVMNTSDVLGTRADLGSANQKVGIDQSTTLYCDGTIHVAWILGGTAGNEFVRYAYATEADAPTFTSNDPTNADTHNPSIGPGASGQIRIYGHGTESPNDDSIYYWTGTGSAGSWSARTLYNTGTFDSSVSTRWAQYFFTKPLTLDVAYWSDATYPNQLTYGVDVFTAPGAASRLHRARVVRR